MEPSVVNKFRSYLNGFRIKKRYIEYFDDVFYQAQDNSIAEECTRLGISPFNHYRRYGWKRKLNPSQYFHVEWYMKNTGLNIEDNIEPLAHYLIEGAARRFSPHPFFDLGWYLSVYEDVRISSIEPLRHFLKYGQREGRRCHPLFPNEYLLIENAAPRSVDHKDIPTGIGDYKLSGAPLVSVIITNLNGISHLKDLFDSLDLQTYKNFEVIFVDDASTDGSVEYALERGANVVPLRTRHGFARANNEGLRHSRGECIALLNNDMRVSAEWLESMMSSLQNDNFVGVVAPLIRFWQKFYTLRLVSRASFTLRLAALENSLTYKKYFVRTGLQLGAELSAQPEGEHHYLEIDLPIQETNFAFDVVADPDSSISIVSSYRSVDFRTKGDGNAFHFAFSKDELSSGFHVINNAGSVSANEGLPEDRGITQRDRGQFSQQDYLQLFCGGAALIRRDALLGNDLFIGDFIAYFEDSELATRIRNAGFLIKYEPGAVCYHRHSATNVEKSAFWRRYTYRNRWLYRYLISDADQKNALKTEALNEMNHLAHWYQGQNLSQSELEFFENMGKIRQEFETITNNIDANNYLSRPGLRIGVYNPHWKTFGGGEAHALSISRLLSEYGQVELISEDDFSVDSLLRYFGFSECNVRKRIVGRMTPEITAEYDVFVNSAYQNEMVSKAKLSFFVVSFPSKTPTQDFIDSYHFLYNSNYTKRWTEKIWARAPKRASVLYPAVSEDFYIASGQQKRRAILTVGRFTNSGHTKGQLEIVKMFKSAIAQQPELMREWKLILIGSVNDVEYLSSVQRSALGYPIEIVTSASYDRVVEEYKRASIYFHASGYGRDESEEPELFEHFGMAVAQGVAAGCLPVVFGAAGPLEIVNLIDEGTTFTDLEDGTQKLLAAAERVSSNGFDKIRSGMISDATMFNGDSQKENFDDIFKPYIGRFRTRVEVA